MGSVFAFTRKVATLDPKATAEEAVRLTSFSALEINKEDLREGQTSQGIPLEPSYSSPLYAINKQKQNPLPGLFNPDLYVTGAFYRGFQITLGNYSFTIDSEDSKAPDLEAKYGKWIYGLSPQGREKYVPILYNKMLTLLKQQIGL